MASSEQRHHQGHEHDHDSCSCGHEHHHDTCGCGQEHHHHDTCGCEQEHHHHDTCGCKQEHHHHDTCGCGQEHHHHDACGCGCGHEHHHSRRDPFEIPAGAVLFAAGLILDRLGLVLPGLAAFVAGYLILGGRVLLDAGRSILRGHVFDENFLMGIATLGAFAIREYPEAIGVMLFYRVGSWFEHRATERSRSQIMDALDLRPEVVHRLDGDTVTVIPAEEARVGDVLLIRPGDRIPLDGVVTEGTSRLDTAPLTGEPIPVSAAPGDSVLSGCVNLSGQLKLRVEKPLSDSMVSRILEAVEHASASKPKIDRFITRFARIYTPAVVCTALATAILPSLFTGDWNYWVYTALSFLVMSCPCALVLSVPLAFFSGIGAGSKRGILFKGGVTMEALKNVRAVVMDKTGTLTRGDFRLQEILPLGSRSRQALLQICAGVEQHSTHPIAHSITEAAREQGLTPEPPLALEELAGRGIVANTREGQVLCGNRKLLEDHGIRLPDIAAANGAEVWLAVNGVAEGRFLISDTLKADASNAVKRLRAMGLHTVMLTGDSTESAESVAAEVGIQEIHARLLPQEKLAALETIRSRRGAVLFVGDGINDAPVLAGADVGAAMGSGADAAIEAADAVFLTSAASAIPDAISLARRTCRIAMQNVIFALAIKLAVMILGLLGHANMWMAVFADSGVAMLCVLNSVRCLYHKGGSHV